MACSRRGLGCTATLAVPRSRRCIRLPTVARTTSCMLFTASIAQEQCTSACIFAIAVVVMAMKPMLLHLTRETGVVPFPAAQFQIGVEVVKTAICAVALGTRFTRGKAVHLWCGWSHSLGFAAPAAVYLLMNILVVHCARMLPPPTFQLLANTKILFTALASWAFMARRITAGQWIALVLLTTGVILGDWRSDGGFEAPLIGVLIMLFNSSLSAYASVLMERRLKAPETKDMSIFATNFHSAMYTILLNSLTLLLITPARSISPRLPSMFEITVLVNEAVNGILMSLLMRRLDGIAKNFAFSASIFVTAGFSAIFLNYRPPLLFYCGAALVAASGLLYAGRAAPQPSVSVRTADVAEVKKIA